MKGEAVLIPGTLCDRRVFGPLLAQLPDVRARIVELAHHSRVEEVAQAALAVAPSRFVAIGFSLGGFVVLEMLRLAPERLRGVALIAGNAHPDASANAAIRRAQVARARAIGMAAFVAENWPQWSTSDNPDIRALVTDMACDMGQDAYVRQAEMNIARPDLREVAEQASVPLLVVAGEQDSLCPPARSAAAAGARGAYVTITGAGHYLPLEAPAAVASALSEWRVAA